jgi:ADP-heptose:LPS heptosyltransferase
MKSLKIYGTTNAGMKGTLRRVLMIKGHSAGIGDVLRSSAGWRALKEKFPDAGLFLLLLTREPGYVSEGLIARHNLLEGLFAVDKRTNGLRGWAVFLREVAKVVDAVRPDLIIDFEPHGMRTSLLSVWMRAKYHVPAVGVGEVPLRGLFYNLSSPSMRKFAKEREIDYPLEYTYRDFVALSALGIERGRTPIEIEETAEGRDFRTKFRERYGIEGDAGILGVNIGCGTEGALCRRPDLGLLSRLVGHLQETFALTVVLVGASFERAVNREFVRLHRERYPYAVHDLAGETSLPELVGLIRGCDLFISSDSGPYHIAVALKVPTLALFSANFRVAFHSDPWVRCVVVKTEDDMPTLIRNAEELFKYGHSG